MRKTAEFSVSDTGDPLILTCLPLLRGWTGGGGTGMEGAESGVEGAESGVEGAGSGSRGGGKRGNCGRGSGKIGGRNCSFY